MGAGFHVKLERDGDGWSLVCGGELDTAASLRLEDALEHCLARRPARVRIDGRDLTFIDLAGASALLRVSHRSVEESFPLAVEVSETVRATLANLGLERILLKHAPLGTS